MQLNLFSTGIKCQVCNKDPGRGNNGYLWNGFLDKDTNQHICNACKTIHYQTKQKAIYKGMYSEIPVLIR